MNLRSPACLAATLMLIVVSAPNSPSSCSSAFTASAVTNWVIGSIRPSSMASPTKSLGAWMVPRSSHQRISASNPTTSSLRISTFGWNAQRNCRSRIASRSRCSSSMRAVTACPMLRSNTAALPLLPLLALDSALSALRRSAA